MPGAQDPRGGGGRMVPGCQGGSMMAVHDIVMQLNVMGWYDVFVNDTVRGFAGMRRRGRSEAG